MMCFVKVKDLFAQQILTVPLKKKLTKQAGQYTIVYQFLNEPWCYSTQRLF